MFIYIIHNLCYHNWHYHRMSMITFLGITIVNDFFFMYYLMSLISWILNPDLEYEK